MNPRNAKFDHFFDRYVSTMADASTGREPDRVDLHELAKGWKAAIARASDASTR